MTRYTELQRQELESFGYVVRSEKEMDAIDRNRKQNLEDNKIKSVPNSSKRKTDAKVEVKIEVDESEDYSYLDELET